MKKIILFLGLMIAFYEGYAQSAPVRMTLSRRDKPISIRADMMSVDIEGYDGNELIVTPVPDSAQTPIAAKGLKQMPLLRAEATDKYPKLIDDEKLLRLTIPPGYASKISIKVPQECLVHLVSMEYIKGHKIYVNNISEIDIGAIVPHIHLNNVSSFIISSGGAALGLSATDRIILSNIRYTDKPFPVNGTPKQPVYAASGTAATIELYVPDNIKADIFGFSEHGRVFSEMATPPADKISERGAEFWKSHFAAEDVPIVKQVTLNGGGLQIGVNSSYGDIIIKKQK